MAKWIAICALSLSLAAGVWGQSAVPIFTYSSGTLAANTRIVFDSNRSGTYQIYTMNTDGTSQTRLTTTSANDRAGVWSPDGSKIAFWSNRDGHAEVYSMNADGTGQSRLTNTSAQSSDPGWSPDGTKIVFWSDRDGNAEIYTMNADGTGQTRLTTNTAFDGCPAWSPDGSKIAFYSDRDGNNEVYTMNADGTGQIRLTTNSATDATPRWSPDGTKIVFYSRRDGNEEVYTMNADGTGQTRRTTNSAFDGLAYWSPDKTKIVFQSQRDGNHQVYVMNEDGTDQTRISNTSSHDTEPSWSPFFRTLNVGSVNVGASGTGMFTVTNRGGATLTVSNISSSDGQFSAAPTSFSVAPGTSQVVTVTFAPTSAGAKSGTLTITHNAVGSPATVAVSGTGIPVPDMQISGRIAFATDKDGNNEIYTINPDGTSQTRLTTNSADDHYGRWSPDGTKIVFRSNRDGNNEVYMMNVDGTGLRNLTNNPANDEAPVWSPDGTKIAFFSNRDGNPEVYTMNADGTSQTRLTNSTTNDDSPAWSPDGAKIAFRTNRDGNLEIYTMNPDGSGLTRLTSNSTTDDTPTWSPDGTKIAFTSLRDGNWEVYAMNADGTDQTNLTNNPTSEGPPAWSPDGTKIAFSSNRDGNYELYTMSATGGNQTRITANTGTDVATSWDTPFRLGVAATGDSVARVVKVKNPGTAPLVVSDITSSNAHFRANPSSFTVAPGDSQGVWVQFLPTSVGTQYSTLTIASNDPDNGTVSLIVNGTGDKVEVSVPYYTTTTYNQSLVIPVQVGGTTGGEIVSAEVFATYDGDLLQSPAVETAGTLSTPNWTVESHVLEGVGTSMDTLKIAMATDEDTLRGAGSLVNLRFQVADVRHPASSVVGLTHALFNAGSPGVVMHNGTVRVVGVDGAITSAPDTVIPRQMIAVTVTDGDENRSVSLAETLSVRVRNGSQTELLRVGETGVNTGVFSGSIATVFSLGSSSGDGTVQAKAGDVIAVAFDDSLDAVGNTVVRTDTTRVRGGQDGQVRVTVVSQPGDTVRVRVADVDLNTDPGLRETRWVGARNVRTGETEVVALTEKTANDTVFFGILKTTLGSGAGTPDDGVVNTQKADTLVVSYVDSLTALGAIVQVQEQNKVVNPFGDADGNGQVQAYDAAKVLYHRLHPYLAGLDSLSANVDLQAPFGPITAYDASLILQKRVGRLSRFPVQEDESVNHPQPETDQSVPKPVLQERVLALQAGSGYVSVWVEERAGIVSGELEIAGITGQAAMGPELGEFLVASQVSGEGVRVVFAGVEGVKGPGELVRVSGVGPTGAQLTRAWLNDGQIGVRLGAGAVAGVLPLAYALYVPQPNPFNPETLIRFDLPQAGPVRLEVYDVVGQKVRVLVSGDLPAGVHRVKWDGRSEAGMPVSSGVYLCRLQAGAFSQAQRLILLK